MKLEFLGTAGYHPTDQRDTSCILVDGVTPEDAFVLDAGTGFYRLIGRTLPPRLHIFLTHAHLDHVCGLTYLFNVLLGQKTEICVYATAPTLQAVTTCLFDSPLFPLPFDYPTRCIEPGVPFEVAGAKVDTFVLTHPGDSLAYRFEFPNTSLAYVTDTAGDARYVNFINCVDLLVHERNFSDELDHIARLSGHCTSADIVRVAQGSRAGRIALTHFNPLTQIEPTNEDALLERLPNVISARDGLVIDF